VRKFTPNHEDQTWVAKDKETTFFTAVPDERAKLYDVFTINSPEFHAQWCDELFKGNTREDYGKNN